MALSRDFAAKMLFWSVIAVAILLFLGVFTPRENRIQKSIAFPEWSAVTSGTSRDKQATSPKKSQERPVASSSRPAAIDREIDWRVVGMIRAKFGHIIREASIAYGIPEIVIIAMIYEESKGNPFEVSPKNCKGLMQICDGAAYEVGVRNVFDPRENILGGARFFVACRRKVGGSFDLSLVAYNAGPYSNLLNKPDFDPAQYEYVRRVKRTIAYLSA